MTMVHDPQRKIDLLRRTLSDAGTTRGEPLAGPHRDGLSDYDVLVVAEFHDRRNAEVFRDLLRGSRIVSSLRRGRQRRFMVEVDMRDRAPAMLLLADHRKRHPDSVRADGRLRHTSAMAGAVIAFIAGLTICFGSSLDWHYVAMPLGYALIGASVGHLFDRLTWRLQSNHRLVVRTIDILIAVWVIPLAIYLFYLLPTVIR